MKFLFHNLPETDRIRKFNGKTHDGTDIVKRVSRESYQTVKEATVTSKKRHITGEIRINCPPQALRRCMDDDDGWMDFMI